MCFLYNNTKVGTSFPLLGDKFNECSLIAFENNVNVNLALSLFLRITSNCGQVKTMGSNISYYKKIKD